MQNSISIDKEMISGSNIQSVSCYRCGSLEHTVKECKKAADPGKKQAK